ncbi:hypothetical protein AYJ66_17165 [Dietzia cinnamea]|nr:hypothetical protein AYJ66_17165 [Dietzia cinnamea]
MLIIVEYRDIRFFFQAFFYSEAVWSSDILQVDSTECRLKQFSSLNNLINICRIQTDREGIDASKTLEKNSFSFHYWKRSFRTDISKAQYGCAIRNNGYHIALHCIIINGFRLIIYFLARLRYTGRIRKTQISCIPYRHF